MTSFNGQLAVIIKKKRKAKFICLVLGLHLTLGTSAILLLLGIELDSLEFEARLPKAAELVLKWLSKPSGKTETFISDWLFVTLR